MTRLNNMPTKVTHLPIMSLFPTAYFVSGEAGTDSGASYADGLKKTTKQNWSYATITAEELAVIVPIPAAVVDDMTGGGYDFWSEVSPRLAEAIGKAIDAADGLAAHHLRGTEAALEPSPADPAGAEQVTDVAAGHGGLRCAGRGARETRSRGGRHRLV